MFNKSLDGILDSFNKISNDLVSFIERTTIEQDMHYEKVAFHTAQVDVKENEITRATQVKSKIDDLIS